MSRVRPNPIDRQTAAAHDQEAGGCLSFYLLPPLSVLLVGLMIALLVFNVPIRQAPPQLGGPSASNQLASLFTPEVQYWNLSILRWSGTTNLDPNLVATVMQIESCGDAFARSSAGALGLFQVMPFHFASTDNPFDPDTNARRGLMYLRQVFDASDHNVSWSLAAYNGGPALIGLNTGRWPAETVRYVYWGSGIYADAAQRRTSSPHLQEWLTAAGAGLCRRAHQQLGLP
ncbi:MAG TPA: transglycosylase SLT domain-containing protein [Anaerolineales bacterium]|nr:transglycosylase SLT domain-containing protein [Anaerolineales bacterium]